jgi:phosphate uptake regulator
MDDLLENKDKYTKEEIAEKVKEVRELYKKIQEELKK